jgi:AcrR family transcriptional regulator
MAPNPSVTRERLVATAEQLFAERGIVGVSLREINAAAGQRNSTALQYHFGDREGLVRAVLAKHDPEVDSRRHALLDEYEAAAPIPAAPRRSGAPPAPRRPDDRPAADRLRVLAGALVRPAAAKLADPDGGRAYLRIMAQLVSRPDLIDRPSKNARASLNRWRRLAGDVLPEIAVTRLHRRYTAIRITFIELALRAEGRPARDERLFTSHLVDLVTAILDAPLSAETARLLDERPARKRA